MAREMSKRDVIQYEIRKMGMLKSAVIRILNFIIRVKSFQKLVGISELLMLCEKTLFRGYVRRL